MPWFWLGIGALALLALIVWGASGPSSRGMTRALSWLFIAFVAVLALFFVARFGGTAALIAALFFFLPLLFRLNGMRRFFRNLRGPTPGESSDVETPILRMHLDHDSGHLDGMVLDGEHRGRYLSELSLEELMALLQECRLRDSESATLLEAYLARHHGAAWQESGEAAGSGEKTHERRGGRAPGSGAAMSREEAYAVLGLKRGASASEIRRAHHELMKKIHPDQGGSNYLATKINQAKETLLGS
jgi:hypothetical protein